MENVTASVSPAKNTKPNAQLNCSHRTRYPMYGDTSNLNIVSALGIVKYFASLA